MSSHSLTWGKLREASLRSICAKFENNDDERSAKELKYTLEVQIVFNRKTML